MVVDDGSEDGERDGDGRIGYSRIYTSKYTGSFYNWAPSQADLAGQAHQWSTGKPSFLPRSFSVTKESPRRGWEVDEHYYFFFF